MTRRLPLLLVALGTVTVQAAPPPEDDTLPSIELLEYLADFVEDEKGRLIDPLSQAETEDDAPRSVSYREYLQRQTDQ